MKKVPVMLLMVALAMAFPQPVGATPAEADPVRLFAFDVDPECRAADCLLVDGAFHPGAAQRSGSGFAGEPLVVPRGADVEFTNLSSEHHNIVSVAKRFGRPLFASDDHVLQGMTSTVTTRYLKPGVYPYFCGHHPATMFGLIEITPGAGTP